MSKRKMNVIALLVALMLVIPTVAAAAAPEVVTAKSAEVQMVFDGKTLKLPEGQYVFIMKGTTYVPIRFVSYALQKNVNWDNAKSTVAVSDPTKQQLIMLKEYLMNMTGKAGEKSSKAGVSKRLVSKEAKFVFNGQEMKLPASQSAYILDGSLYVPVRFMSESSGIKISWNQKDSKITAQSSGGQNDKPAAGKDNAGNDNNQENNSNGGNPGGGGAEPGKSSYETITSNAQSRLGSLENRCMDEIITIGGKYLSDQITLDEAKRQGEAALSNCRTQFESILSDVEQQLTSNGYSTSIIQEYRTTFNNKIEDLRKRYGV
ncbi:copper amine oxidase N-terminal domain-containing protein [Paenibacillus sp. GCM10012307]|uniref:Copper amine oxidase N-terminal domain-containing protein n=1 Tax=Paenibacillus roseus TaxID=2798579 RepID=A0A934MKZ7_9BACL|nr:copper amine oxidase N-terminal domain-containing protein [Paenibacillus roseus]MBJ6361615.1 copper amine oxidase N-terminal domain-containing protein [Paenibacillus roseus]